MWASAIIKLYQSFFVPDLSPYEDTSYGSSHYQFDVSHAFHSASNQRDSLFCKVVTLHATRPSFKTLESSLHLIFKARQLPPGTDNGRKRELPFCHKSSVCRGETYLAQGGAVQRSHTDYSGMLRSRGAKTCLPFTHKVRLKWVKAPVNPKASLQL